ncbi:MAG: hypothetical protein RR368_03130 [Oscillospiraceae bacterium]
MKVHIKNKANKAVAALMLAAAFAVIFFITFTMINTNMEMDNFTGFDFSAHAAFCDEFFAGKYKAIHPGLYLFTGLVKVISFGHWDTNTALMLVCSLFQAFSVALTGFTFYLMANKRIIAILVGMAVSVCTSIWMPSFSNDIYLGQFSGAIWHNPTYMIMRPFSILAWLWFFYLAQKYIQNSDGRGMLSGFFGDIKDGGFRNAGSGLLRSYDKKEVLTLSLCSIFMMMTSVVKPNFLFAFIPAMGLLLLIYAKRFDWKSWLKLMLVLFFAGLFICAQFILSEDPTNTLSATFFNVWKLYSTNITVSLLLALAFPMAYTLFFWYDDKLKDNLRLVGAWLFWIISFFEAAFIAESGSRYGHMNFVWGYNLALYFLLFECALSMLKNIRSKTSSKKKMAAAALCILLFAAHLISGVIYLYRMHDGGTYA